MAAEPVQFVKYMVLQETFSYSSMEIIGKLNYEGT